jgi:hypothetical protein
MWFATIADSPIVSSVANGRLRIKACSAAGEDSSKYAGKYNVRHPTLK